MLKFAQIFKSAGDKFGDEQRAPLTEVTETLAKNATNRAIPVSMRKYLHVDCCRDNILNHFMFFLLSLND